VQCMLFFAIFERHLYKYGKYLVSEINLRLQSGTNVDNVRFVAEVE